MNTYFRILELDATQPLTPEVVKRASRRLIMKYHPDVNPHRREWAEVKTRQVLEASNAVVDAITHHPDQIVFRSVESFQSEPPRATVIHASVTLFEFKLGGLSFAVPIDLVMGVEPMSESLQMTPCFRGLGKMFAEVTGIISWREHLVPVIDFAVRCNLTYKRHGHPYLLITHQNMVFSGFMIDQPKGPVSLGQMAYDEERALFQGRSLADKIALARQYQAVCILDEVDLL